MKNRASFIIYFLIILLFLSFTVLGALAASEQFKGKIFNPGVLKPILTKTHLKKGMKAPDFSLPSISGEKVSLSQFRGKKNVVISFVPAAWTPVCSDQWPGYNIAKSLFEKNNAILLGITVDNIPTLYAWTKEMGDLWFPVLSDFYPHGAVAKKYGILRTDGVSERALFVIDKKGIIRYIDVHDINSRPNLEMLIKELEKLEK
ncbi:MAG: redoxin domain-containing protein [Nitrospirae bacterium]|jgi:peroxiredoxin (alkyl hydroperoxide reductase subunit C)|nr:redoxin domain-containing protein [Nitrospirota bacterium]